MGISASLLVARLDLALGIPLLSLCALCLAALLSQVWIIAQGDV